MREYYTQDRGTVRSGPPYVSERIVSPREASGLQQISYGRMSLVTGGEENYFWAPQSFQRYVDPYSAPSAVVILDEHGWVKCYYEEGHVYLMEYE